MFIFWRKSNRTVRLRKSGIKGLGILTRPQKTPKEFPDRTSDRQERIPGFKQEVLDVAHFGIAGLGGLGSWLALDAVKKGFRRLTLIDPDSVDNTNLTRQFYAAKDLLQPKAIACAKAVAPYATNPSGCIIDAWVSDFEGAVESGVDLCCDVFAIGIDDNNSKEFIARWCYQNNKSAVFYNVDDVGEAASCFIQIPGQACLICARPNLVNGGKLPCKAGAVVNNLRAAQALALHAIDSVLMGRPRNWNYAEIHLAGFDDRPSCKTVQRRPECPMCSRKGENAYVK